MPQQNPILSKGRYDVRRASTPGDIAIARALRRRCFALSGPDADRYDDTSLHMLVENRQTGAVVCCFRLCVLDKCVDTKDSYSAQFYDLEPLLSRGGRLVEMGRFCIDPELQDADVLRAAWGALTAFVDDVGARMLIGCSSFAGTDPGRYRDAFSELAARYLAPSDWQVKTTSPCAVCYAEDYAHRHDVARALLQMPSLLRSYLSMGGRVSDHAVIDREMNTLHVFTGLEIAAIPEKRKRLLRALTR